jgi:Xaa-Pro dipeptidase
MSAQSPRPTGVERGSGPLIDPSPFTGAEFERRLQGLREAMLDRELDAYIAFSPENLYYLTGHDTPGYYYFQACVVTNDHVPINVLRRNEVTNTVGRGWSREAVPYEDVGDPVATTLSLLDELGVGGGRIGAEDDAWFVSPKRYAALATGVARRGGSLLPASGLVEALRLVKSEEEIAYIREGAAIAELAMSAAIGASSDGANENDIAARALSTLASNGGEYAGLPPFITSGPRTYLAHATWSGRQLLAGDPLLYELPGVRRRYCAALLRSGSVGRPGREVASLAEMVEESLKAAIGAIRPGVTSHDVHTARTKVFARHKRGELVTHRTGYSIGINYPPDWGEGQIFSLWEGDERTLTENMTFHLVPGGIVESRFALFIGETVRVTSDGCEAITQFPRDLFIV